MRIKNLPSISSMDGSQDALIIEQTDGSEDKSRKVTPAQIKQYVLGNSIDDVYSVMGRMGAKNLLPYPYYETNHEDHGITWTDNGDGTITANGTATGGNSQFICSIQLVDVIPANTELIITGCPSGGSMSTYGVTVDKYVSSYSAITRDFGEGSQFTMPTDVSRVRVVPYIISGQTVSNLTFKPMLRLASDTDETYQPYAMTNKQLTDEIQRILSRL